MKRVNDVDYENGEVKRIMVSGIDVEEPEKSYPFDRVIWSHWIAMGDCGVTKCAHCGWNIEECISYKRCPECGAYMEGKEEK